jgi:hypothetical protein
VSEELEAIIVKALSMAPKDRYISAKEMKKAIEEYEENKKIKNDKHPVKAITEEDNLLKEDIKQYEVEIKEKVNAPVIPLITALSPSGENTEKAKQLFL